MSFTITYEREFEKHCHLLAEHLERGGKCLWSLQPFTKEFAIVVIWRHVYFLILKCSTRQSQIVDFDTSWGWY